MCVYAHVHSLALISYVHTTSKSWWLYVMHNVRIILSNTDLLQYTCKQSSLHTVVYHVVVLLHCCCIFNIHDMIITMPHLSLVSLHFEFMFIFISSCVYVICTATLTTVYGSDLSASVFFYQRHFAQHKLGTRLHVQCATYMHVRACTRLA